MGEKICNPFFHGHFGFRRTVLYPVELRLHFKRRKVGSHAGGCRGKVFLRRRLRAGIRVLSLTRGGVPAKCGRMKLCAALSFRLFALLLVTLTQVRAGAGLPAFDFTGGKDAQGWTATHDIAELKPSREGLVAKISGDDAYMRGPRGDCLANGQLIFTATLRSPASGWGQVFFSSGPDSERQSAHFAVREGWNHVCVPLPAMGTGWRLRLDFCATSGECVLARTALEEAGARGVAYVRAEGERLLLSLRGISGPVEIAELQPHQTFADAAGAPVVWKGDATGEIAIPLKDGVRDRLASGFIAFTPHAVLGRVPIGAARHVEDFNGIARDTRAFPRPTSKKGIQVQMPDDALALGIRHATLNVSVDAIFDWDKKPGSPVWTVDGETFAFRRAYLDSLGVKRLSAAGVNVYLIVLGIESRNAARDARMLHPARDAKIHNGIAAPNLATPEGVRLWRAAFEFLADWFSRADDEHGRVAGYIIGNEVNVHWQWHNLGRMPRLPAVAEYEREVRLAHTAIRRTSSTARVYLSLTHFWTIDPDADHWRSMPGRYFIEEFARCARSGGDFDWHLAHHPYPENLGNPRTWLDKTAPQSPDAKRITFKNLEQLCVFFAQPSLLFRGARRSIILSEQGFHSTGTAEGDRLQAAGFCYAWEKVSRLAGIDAFILHRHVDHQYEGGLNLGLWRRKPDSIATPDTQRPIYGCFKSAGTPAQEEAFRFALPVIGVKSWDEIMAPEPHD